MEVIPNIKLRVVCITALFLFVSYQSKAQQAHFGIKGGLNYSSIVGDLTEGLKFRFSGHGGVFVEIDFSENFKIQPELLYSSQGFQFSTDLATIESGGNPTDQNDFRTNVQLNFITVPILGKFYLNDRWDVEFGPQFGFLINQITKTKELDQVSSAGADRKSTIAGDFQLDYGAAVGVGFKISESLSVSPRIYLGLRNRLNALQGSQNYNAAMQLSLNYLFR